MDLARDRDAAGGIGMDADGIRFNRYFGAVAGENLVADGDVHGLLGRSLRIVDKRAGKSAFAQSTIRLINAAAKASAANRNPIDCQTLNADEPA